MDDISSQRPLFSEDPGTLGFDLSAGDVWIYPENYPVREYQFSIVKKALFCNTLVCLPTGLGKTFIAAVLMYNYWRWYPKGKVVFLAPTKPLVAQQIHACHDIMGIPSEETIELTGTTNQKLREVAWVNKRVIFATPQTFHKDLEKNILPINLVKCLVIDEAHRALGKHSYCESVRLLSEKNNFFRVLALSATPGDKISKVLEVITSLHISNLELRDDSSADLAPYINERKLDIILVRLNDELAKFKERYIGVMDPHVRLLVRFNILRGDTGNISKGRIFHLVREFQTKTDKSGNFGQIMKTLNILLTMSHAYELMIRHGLRAFLHFYENHSDKFWMAQEISLHELLEDVKTYLGPFPTIVPLPDGTIPEISKNLVFGHNKFFKLKEVLERHFKLFRNKNQDTRAIVFVEYRDIVNEVYVLLLQCRPLIRPQMFVGQAGQKQKQQIQALENFRCNEVNVLISTSVGEEGLDVGEVDLIVCFDISQSSPIRLVQRMGRTGRKRDGHIIALVTDGKEHQSLMATMSKKDTLNNKVLKSHDIVSALYKESPRMIPNECKPECRKMHMKVLTKISEVKGAAKKKEVQKNRRKPVDPKPVEHDPGNKNTGQSSIHKFFKTAKPGEKVVDLNHSIFSQSNQNINIKDVNLYFSDKESEEFLTLCAMRKSIDDSDDILNFKIDTRYIPVCTSKGLDSLRNLVIPDLNILDCVKSIPKAQETMQIMENDEMSICPINEQTFESSCFETRNRFSEVSIKPNEVTIKRSFVDVLYDSSSPERSSEDDEKAVNKFEITRNFDDLLIETTDESENEVIEGSQEHENSRKTSFRESSSKQRENFSKMLDTSFEFVSSQDSSKTVTLDNKETACEENNPSRQLNDSRNISYISLGSNCSGLTISQTLEEIRRINASKSADNNNLINEKNNSVIKTVNNSPVSKKSQDYSKLMKDFPASQLLKDFPFTQIMKDSSISKKSTDSKIIKHTPVCVTIEETPESEIIEDSSESIRIERPSTSKINKDSSLSETKQNFPIFKKNKDSPTSKLMKCFPDSQVMKNGSISQTRKDCRFSQIVKDSQVSTKSKDSLMSKVKNNSVSRMIEYPQKSIIIENSQGSKIIEKPPKSKIIEDTRKSCTIEKEKLPSVSNIEKIQKKNALLEILDSDEDFFNDEFDDLILNDDKILDSSGTKDSLRKNDKNPGIQNCQIARVNSNKEKTVNKENSNLAFNTINDDDWGSDFEVSTAEIISPKFFKKTETVNSTNKTISCEGTSNTSQPPKKFSLFNWNKPKIFQDEKIQDKIVTAKVQDQSLFNSSANDKEKNNIGDSEVFKKPALRAPGFFSLKRLTSNVPSTSNCKVSGSASSSKKCDLNPKVNKGRASPEPSLYTSSDESPEIKRKKIKKSRVNCKFIDNEADVSMDGGETTEGSSGEDEDLDGFVSHTQNVQDAVDMQAHYLKSVRSPARRPGAFLIKKTARFEQNVYSQPVSQAEDTYINDSFCVREDECEYDEDTDDDLEITFEQLTETTINRSKRKREKSPVFRINKRRKKKSRIQNVNSSSSEDEAEDMRKQILEESFLLREKAK